MPRHWGETVKPVRSPAAASPRDAKSTGGATSALRGRGNRLVCTDLDGVYRNVMGSMVDANGVALSFATIRNLDDQRFTESSGAPARSPAEVLRGVALDPRMHLDVRLKAAKEAAPYYDMKMPVRVEAEVNNTGGLDLGALSKLPRAERQMLLDLLQRVGVKL